MAKTKTPEAEPTPSTAVVQTRGGAVQLPYQYGELAGRGFQNMDSSDMAIPFIALLQSNSPEVDGSVPERAIEGARAGFFMDTVTREVFDGKVGFHFVPCATMHSFVEWRPRDSGGGFVGQHSPSSPFVAESKEQSGVTFGKIPTKNKTELIETFYVIGLVLEKADATEPLGFAMIAFTSTKIKVYKKSIGELQKLAKHVPLFANRLLIRAAADQNAKGRFFNFSVQPALGEDGQDLLERRVQSLLPPDHPLMRAASRLEEEFLAGKAKVAYDTQAAEAEADEDAEPRDRHF